MAETKKRTRKPRPPRSKQPYLHPDMAPPSHPDVDAAADHYYDTMTERVGLSKLEDEAKDNLIDKMKEHKISTYTTPDGLIVTIVDKSNVRCKKRKDESNGATD